MTLTKANHVALAEDLCSRATIEPATGIFPKLAQTVQMWNHRVKERNMLRRLNADQLEDIGLSPSQINKETRKPFWRA